jgi:hypothetical protein
MADESVVTANTGSLETGRQARFILDALEPGEQNQLQATLDRADAALGAHGLPGAGFDTCDTRQSETVELLEAIVQMIRHSAECPPACMDLLRHMCISRCPD